MRHRERRLDDLLAGWARTGSSLVSIQRLKALAKHFPGQVQEEVARFARHAADAGDRRWRAHAGAEGFGDRGKDFGQPRLLEGPGLMLRLRAGIGVGAKADLLTYLLGIHGASADLRALTVATGYSDRALRTAADEMALARFIRTVVGTPSAYRADPDAWTPLLGAGGGEVPPWQFWSVAFAFLTAVGTWEREASLHGWSGYVASSRARSHGVARTPDALPVRATGLRSRRARGGVPGCIPGYGEAACALDARALVPATQSAPTFHRQVIGSDPHAGRLCSAGRCRPLSLDCPPCRAMGALEDHMQDFFVSYNQADRSWAEWIAWELEEAGYSVVIQAWDFRPGSNFVLEMDRALKEAERMIIVLSPDYIRSSFTAPEWAAGFARDSTGQDRKLVPVRVRDVDPSGLLGQIVYIDFVGVTDETATQKLLVDGVQQGRSKPTQKPSFPGAPIRLVRERPRYPGGRPPIWNVPQNRNRNFTGRDELLSTLRSQLLAGHHSALTALHGLGGIGKTQTAVEYTYRYAGEYELVWWIHSEDPATLKGDYSHLAAKLCLPETEADQETAIRAVKEKLSVTGGWLLVFDNAPNAVEIQSYLPGDSSGHVLITSRSPDWRTVAAPLSVGALSSQEAVDFLHRRSGQQDERASLELVKELGWLPLAIEQAAAYIDAYGSPIADYLKLFRKHQQKILTRGQQSHDYPHTLETTWELSFAKVEQQSSAGAALLCLCAFLAPDDIPLDLIKPSSDRVPEPLRRALVEDLELDDAIAALRRYSLVERIGDSLSVHRLVQAVARDRMEKGNREIWATSAAGVIFDAFPYDSYDVRTWPACIRLLPHATTVAARCEIEEAGLGIAAGLLAHSALYLYARADFAGARDLNERALNLHVASYGPDHPHVAGLLNNLGTVLSALGKLEEARMHFTRALSINEASYGPDHPHVANNLNNLGTVLHDLGNLEEARRNYTRALSIDEASYGPDHPDIAIRLNNLGRVLHDLGNLTEAQGHLTRALRINEASYGPDHPFVAIRLSNLGRVLQDLGNLEEAQSHFMRALSIDEASYGPDHPSVAIRLGNLGRVLQDLGRAQEAQSHFTRALSINVASYGPEHYKVAESLNNLGRVLHDLGNHDEARRHYTRALTIMEAKLGLNHPKAEIVRNNLRLLDPPTPRDS